MIEVTEFSKSYSSKKNDFAVENISLKSQKGFVTGLIGPNGSGKTTVMKAICGFHYPTKGHILITDNNDNSFYIENDSQMAMQLIGYVPENPCLPPEMKVREFLIYAGMCHNLSKNQTDKALMKVVKECNLENFLDKKIKKLSKGQKQRVSFAQALIYDPPNLILDEPVSGLDPAQIIQIRKLIQKLSKDKAILMSTHILQEINSLCGSLYILNQGKIVCQGSEEEIIKKTHSENLENAFLKLTTDSEI